MLSQGAIIIIQVKFLSILTGSSTAALQISDTLLWGHYL